MTAHEGHTASGRECEIKCPLKWQAWAQASTKSVSLNLMSAGDESSAALKVTVHVKRLDSRAATGYPMYEYEMSTEKETRSAKDSREPN